jgi:hypothetical protein
MTPARGAGDIASVPHCCGEGTAAPAATILSPVARDYPSRAFEGFFRPSRCDCSIKERADVVMPLRFGEAFLIHNPFTYKCCE